MTKSIALFISHINIRSSRYKNALHRHIFKIDYYLITVMNGSLDPELSIIKSLRKKGYKATPQRIAIGRFLLHNREHPSAQKIYREVKKIYPTVSLTTVYKTTKILKEVGLIRELNLSNIQTRYDPNITPHAHLICLRCRRISDWTDPIIKKLMEKISAATRFIPEEPNFAVYGICSTCDLRTPSLRDEP